MKLAEKFLTELSDTLREERGACHQVFHALQGFQRPVLLRSEILACIEEVLDGEAAERLKGSPLAKAIGWTQEAVVHSPWLWLEVRPRAGLRHFLQFHSETMSVNVVDVAEYLHAKERLIDPDNTGERHLLEFDIEPFTRDLPKMQEAHSIGSGVEFLNRRLSSQLFSRDGKGEQLLFEFLRVHSCNGRPLLLGNAIEDPDGLRQALREADAYLAKQDAETTWGEHAPALEKLGFTVGWGAKVRQIRKTMGLLLDIMEAPSPAAVEAFLARIPMIFSIAILSPHGWFGQANVLGRPDTGGQVVYILDQVRALERQMKDVLSSQGVEIDPKIVVVTRLIPEAEDTDCNLRLEPIAGTEHATILRVPFREASGEVVPQWISRFKIWPYLERFSFDAEKELLAEIGGRPDLIIGNYSDGNLVASLLAPRLGVTQCTIAHALEKTKYLYSDLFWKDSDPHYHFSCQFTADLIAMNSSDFIITSTYQEIAGTEQTIGQYEAYESFTMPGLYRVVQGIDVHGANFNIVSPGADEEIYFPADRKEDRRLHMLPEIERLVYGDHEGDVAKGVLADRDKPLLFSMARMDKIKNLTGLVDAYGRNPQLREAVNLLIVGGCVRPDKSGDPEERDQVETMLRLFDEHGLHDQVRWVEGQVNRERNGELYRYVADSRGAFVQPALFEAFGLTVIEAMSTGLPTFATCFGGPLEIIEDGTSGFHIDPTHGDEYSASMAKFFTRCREQPDYWNEISRGALDRIEARYTWRLYAERLLTLSKVYGFWKFVTRLERDEARRYLEMFYTLQFRPRAEAIGTGDDPSSTS